MYLCYVGNQRTQCVKLLLHSASPSPLRNESLGPVIFQFGLGTIILGRCCCFRRMLSIVIFFFFFSFPFSFSLHLPIKAWKGAKCGALIINIHSIVIVLIKRVCRGWKELIVNKTISDEVRTEVTVSIFILPSDQIDELIKIWIVNEVVQLKIIDVRLCVLVNCIHSFHVRAWVVRSLILIYIEGWHDY